MLGMYCLLFLLFVLDIYIGGLYENKSFPGNTACPIRVEEEYYEINAFISMLMQTEESLKFFSEVQT